jgi:diacylglycerol kinase (ATP)
MSQPHDPERSEESPPTSPFKSRSGLSRLWRAFGYSVSGLVSAWKREAAFRQEVSVGALLIGLAWWIAPDRIGALILSGAVVLVWIVELLNSAIEAIADSVSLERHPMLAIGKDLGSAAVMTTIALAAAAWVVVLWPA